MHPSKALKPLNCGPNIDPDFRIENHFFSQRDGARGKPAHISRTTGLVWLHRQGAGISHGRAPRSFYSETAYRFAVTGHRLPTRKIATVGAVAAPIRCKVVLKAASNISAVHKACARRRSIRMGNVGAARGAARLENLNFALWRSMRFRKGQLYRVSQNNAQHKQALRHLKDFHLLHRVSRDPRLYTGASQHVKNQTGQILKIKIKLRSGPRMTFLNWRP